jgi:nucleoside-diphosphate-sugar epimerase
LLAAEAPADRVVGLAMNAACGDRFTLNELFEAIREIVGSDVRPTYAPPRVGDVKHSQADISLARERLGYEPTTSLQEGLQRCVDFYASRRLAAAR